MLKYKLCGCSSGVEHNLAKVGVEGSNPFTRSRNKMIYINYKKYFSAFVVSFILIFLLANCSNKFISKDSITTLMEEKEIILQKKILIKEMADSTRILHNISWPILKKNKDLCKSSNYFSYGIIFATANDIAAKELFLYKELFNNNVKNDYFKAYKTDSFPIIISVASDSPAKKAELKERDIVLEINKRNTRNFRKKLSHELFSENFLEIKILRKDKILIKKINGIKICNYNIQPLPAAMPNAFADGKKVFVTLGAIKLANAVDELAFLIGHELAHNIFHFKSAGSNEAHTQSIKYDDKPKIRELKSILVYSNQEREIEADIKGLELAYNGGFDLKNVNDYWRRLSVFYPELITKASLYYKGNAFRASLITETLKKIKERNNK